MALYRSCMFLWRKSATAGWVQTHEVELELLGAAIIEQLGRRRVLVEICCETRTKGRELTRQFGGRFERVDPTAQAKWLRAPENPPLKIGKRLVIVGGRSLLQTAASPAGIGGRRRRISQQLIVPAEAAFGTGHHATTATCLRLLERVSRFLQGWSLLDAGTGSGILALAGRLFGATRVVAIDTDPLAIRTARRNAKLNDIQGVKFNVADATVDLAVFGRFDVVTANLFSEVIIESLPCFAKALKPGGVLILSGILREQEEEVLRALERRFVLEKRQRSGKWVALLARSTKRG